MDPCSIRGEGTLKWRYMKKEELKQDPVAEKIVAAVQFAKNNTVSIFLGIVVIMLIVVGLSYFNKTSEHYALESKLAVDEIMIQLINEGLNDPDYFNDKLNDQIDSIYKTYPDSKYIDYLAFILSKQNVDTISVASFIDKINIIKNKIDNKWFKTQAFLISGDYYSDNSQFDLAKNEYKNAVKHSQSNAQKGYSHYKLGNIYFELGNLNKALSNFEEASNFFDLSKENSAVSRNQQFSSWIDRNSIALHKVKTILKK